ECGVVNLGTFRCDCVSIAGRLARGRGAPSTGHDHQPWWRTGTQDRRSHTNGSTGGPGASASGGTGASYTDTASGSAAENGAAGSEGETAAGGEAGKGSAGSGCQTREHPAAAHRRQRTR